MSVFSLRLSATDMVAGRGRGRGQGRGGRGCLTCLLCLVGSGRRNKWNVCPNQGHQVGMHLTVRLTIQSLRSRFERAVMMFVPRGRCFSPSRQRPRCRTPCSAILGALNVMHAARSPGAIGGCSSRGELRTWASLRLAVLCFRGRTQLPCEHQCVWLCIPLREAGWSGMALLLRQAADMQQRPVHASTPAYILVAERSQTVHCVRLAACGARRLVGWAPIVSAPGRLRRLRWVGTTCAEREDRTVQQVGYPGDRCRDIKPYVVPAMSESSEPSSVVLPPNPTNRRTCVEACTASCPRPHAPPLLSHINQPMRTVSRAREMNRKEATSDARAKQRSLSGHVTESK